MRLRNLLVFAAVLTCSSVATAQEPSTPPAQPPPPTEAAQPAEPPPPAATTPPAAVQPAPAAEAPIEVAAPKPKPAPEVTATEAAPAAVAASEPADPPVVAFGPHVGILIPQLFGELGAWPIFGVELGYILPFDATDTMRRPLQLTFDILYTQPGAKGTEDAPALGEDGQTFDWKLKERILVLELGGIWRFMTPGEGLSPFASLGGRMYLTESIMSASSAGADFGENRETKTQFGFVLGGGAEYAVGPGAVFGALEIGWSDLKQRITGDSNTGALVIDFGYRFMF